MAAIIGGIMKAEPKKHLWQFLDHRVASTPELATNFIDYKQMAGMMTVRKSCNYTVLSRRYALRWIYILSEHIHL